MSQTTILIVEDDAGLREALVDTLLLGGYKVLEADCAERGLMMMNQESIDLVVSDIQMGNTIEKHAPPDTKLDACTSP